MTPTPDRTQGEAMSEPRACMTAQECRSVVKFAGEQTRNLRALRAAVEAFIKVRGVDGRQSDEERTFQEMCMTLADQYPKDTADA